MQEVLERAITEITAEQVTVTGSGRTDAGAHALGQVVMFTTSTMLPASVIGRALNAVLPRDVAVTESIEIESDFHPRYDARSRTYRYLIWNRKIRSPFWEGRAAHVPFPLDVGLMNEGGSFLLGRHDFSSFAPVKHGGERVRTIYRCEVARDGDMVSIELEGTGFMKQMVRSIVGTLIHVGGGRKSPSEIRRILESGDRRQAGETAPSAGLYLATVSYSMKVSESEHEPWYTAKSACTREEENS